MTYIPVKMIWQIHALQGHDMKGFMQEGAEHLISKCTKKGK